MPGNRGWQASSGIHGFFRLWQTCKEWKKSLTGKAAAAPVLWTLTPELPCLGWAASMRNRPQVTHQQSRVSSFHTLQCTGWKAIMVQRLMHEQICRASQGQPVLSTPNCHRLQLSSFLPHLHVFFLWFFHYNCTVWKSYNSPYRTAPAARKLTIQHSIPISSVTFYGQLWVESSKSVLESIALTSAILTSKN